VLADDRQKDVGNKAVLEEVVMENVVFDGEAEWQRSVCGSVVRQGSLNGEGTGD